MPKTLFGLLGSFLGLALFDTGAGSLHAQQCDSTVVGAQMLPTLSGPTVSDMVVSSNYLYLVTQWGMARGPIQSDGTVVPSTCSESGTRRDTPA